MYLMLNNNKNDDDNNKKKNNDNNSMSLDNDDCSNNNNLQKKIYITINQRKISETAQSWLHLHQIISVLLASFGRSYRLS